MITREQVGALQPGDVVRCTSPRYPGLFSEGPLRESGGRLMLGGSVIRCDDGSPSYPDWTLTVVSRAARPLYVNHPRTEPVPGDVVRDADSSNDRHTWVKNVDGFTHEWLAVPGHVYVPREQLPDRLRLLVDGETGQVVTS